MTTLRYTIAFGQQFLGKTDDIRLEVSIWPSILEQGDTAWANAIRFRKVTIQAFLANHRSGFFRSFRMSLEIKAYLYRVNTYNIIPG
jgi:hypothetical protein